MDEADGGGTLLRDESITRPSHNGQGGLRNARPLGPGRPYQSRVVSRLLRSDQIVLFEQSFEVVQSRQVFRTKPVMEATEVGLRLGRGPSRLRELPRDFREAREPGRERGLEELAQLAPGSPDRVSGARPRPRRRTKGPSTRASPRRGRARVKPSGRWLRISSRDRRSRAARRPGRLEPPHVAHAGEPAPDVEEEPKEPDRGRGLGRHRDERSGERRGRPPRVEQHRLHRATGGHAHRDPPARRSLASRR